MLASVRSLAIVLSILAISCGKPKGGGETLAPLNLADMPLPTMEGNEGIYPSSAVMEDAQNPFARSAVTEANRWAMTGWAMEGGAPAARLAAMFYVWATELAIGHSGQAQFQVAVALKGLATHAALDDVQKALYRASAIRAYQSMLDNFKDSLGYTAEGYSYRLVPVAFYAIRELGGTPQGRWVETVDPYGNKIVVEI